MLLIYNEKCQELMNSFRLVTLRHVSREQNVEANDLAQGASGYKPIVQDIEVEVAAITTDDWRYDVFSICRILLNRLHKNCAIKL